VRSRQCLGSFIMDADIAMQRPRYVGAWFPAPPIRPQYHRFAKGAWQFRPPSRAWSAASWRIANQAHGCTESPRCRAVTGPVVLTMSYTRRARESLPDGSALVLVCAIGCTLVAAYQWAARVGAFERRTRCWRPRIGNAARGALHSPSSSGWFGWFCTWEAFTSPFS